MQVDGYSLDAQKEKLRRYAEFQNMESGSEFRLQEEHDINSNEKFQSHHDGTVKRANQ